MNYEDWKKLKETKKFAPLFFFYADFLWTTVGPNSSYSALLTCCCCWNTTRARIAPPAQAAEAAPAAPSLNPESRFALGSALAAGAAANPACGDQGRTIKFLDW